LNRLSRQAQPGSCEAIAEEIKTAFDPADEGLARVLLQIKRPKHPVDRLDRAARKTLAG
jgi:hypothetical protein